MYYFGTDKHEIYMENQSKIQQLLARQDEAIFGRKFQNKALIFACLNNNSLKIRTTYLIADFNLFLMLYSRIFQIHFGNWARNHLAKKFKFTVAM